MIDEEKKKKKEQEEPILDRPERPVTPPNQMDVSISNSEAEQENQEEEEQKMVGQVVYVYNNPIEDREIIGYL